MIEHVSDTARWVAMYRAAESERPDAIFHDPFARRLAGERGADILKSVRRAGRMSWAIVTRTAVFDEIVLDAIREHGADAVVNLAAGLDARPWRLDVPTALRWYDVDLPGILDHKSAILANESPRCQYEAVRADLRDADVRRRVFERIGGSAARVLVVSEGLLGYLEPAEVAGLAASLADQPSFFRWALDLASPMALQYMNREYRQTLERAPFRFGPAEGPKFFEPFGWTEVAFRPAGDEARRLHREMRGMAVLRVVAKLFPKEKQEQWRRMTAFVVLKNSRSTNA